MKMKFFYVVVLSAVASLYSCKKDDKDQPNPTPTEPTVVSIGGREYPIVKIGTQSWTGVNYNGAGGSYFNEVSPVVVYGKLYTYTEAMAVTPPAGWHLPSQADYVKLLESQGATFTDGKTTQVDAIKKITSVSGWAGGFQGTNTSTFNAFPAGYYTGTSFSYEGTLTIFWTSSKVIGTNTPYFLSVGSTEASFYADAVTTQRFSLRFVKDN
ncbi:FISUMP domain-containing protein [Flavisolibacter tropicus]|nr:FISUMP domain-containing protein [Flavisolibacter tropicus]